MPVGLSCRFFRGIHQLPSPSFVIYHHPNPSPPDAVRLSIDEDAFGAETGTSKYQNLPLNLRQILITARSSQMVPEKVKLLESFE
jgi:hypothetical protein